MFIRIFILFFITSAYGITYYNIDFSIPPANVITPYFQDASVTTPKIPDKAVPAGILMPDPGDQPAVGDVFRWSDATQSFFLSPDNTRVGPGGGINSLTMGKGLKNQGTSQPNPPASGVVILEVNKGTKGAGAITKIPYINSNKLIIDNPGSMVFNSSPTDYALYTNGKLILQNHSTSWPLMSIDKNGPVDFGDLLRVDGKLVCLSNGQDCPSQSFISQIIVNPPLIGGGNSGTVTIGANTGISPGQLVKLTASASTPTIGAIPAVDGSKLLGIVSKINSSNTISASDLLGNTTISAKFAQNGIQSWQTYLTDLGNLNPNENDVIMGNGFTFYTVGGTTMQSNIGLLPGRDVQAYSEGLTDIGPITPASNTYLGGNGTNWVAKTIPSCSSGYFVQVNTSGSDFICSSNNTNFSSADFISDNQEGVRVALSGGNPSEFHFYGTNSNFIGFKAPASPSTNTIWTLPPSDGAAGQFLSTNGSGVLSFVTNYDGDVTGPTLSSSTYAPLFSDDTGKVLKNQTTLMVDTTNSRVGINTSTPGNKFSIATAANQQGIESGASFLGTCTGTAYGCFTNSNNKATSNAYGILQESTGQTDLNAASDKSITFKINDVAKVTIDKDGYFGIGETDASKPLEVVGAGATNGAILGNAFIGETATYGNGWTAFLNSAMGDSSYGLLQNNSGITLLNAATNQYIGFHINNVEKMRMTSDGKLGIGTNNPADKLTVNNGNVRLENQDSPKLIIKGNGIEDANSGEVQFLESGGVGWTIRHNSLNDAIGFFRIRGGMTERFRMTDYGELFATITNIGNLSDRTLKKNIVDFSDTASDIIDKFRPVTFFWKENDKGPHTGLLAQEVEKIDPRFVVLNPVSNKLMIKYDELLPVMIANLKELRKRNQKLKETLSKIDIGDLELKKMVEELRKKNQLIKSELNQIRERANGI
jgi:Chaperone of endosialidase